LGCEHPAVWQPVLEFRAPGSDVVAPALLRLGICEKHKAETVLADVMGDEGFAQIAAGMEKAGFVAPDRQRTTLGWKRIGAEA
jgi:hypothetical protein